MRIGVAGVGRIGALHATTLCGLPGVDVVIADSEPALAQRVADETGASLAPDAAGLLAHGLDGFVITTATPCHAPLLREALAAGVPTFCEKPVAATLTEAIELASLADSAEVAVQVGFQRRFDAGYERVRSAVASGELGTVHAVRATTHDHPVPPASYIATSGGIFRDCAIHDFDAVRFVTGREVVSVYATGENAGAPFFSEAGDVDTGAAILTLDDGTLVTSTATRYSGAGHDVRMEVMGSAGALAVGLDDSLALASAEPGVHFPAGPAHRSFVQRFLAAYRAEMSAFLAVVAGRGPSRCTVRDGLEALRVAEACELSRSAQRPVRMSEIATVAA